MPKATLQLRAPDTPVPLTAADSKRLGRELTELYHDAVAGHLRVLTFGSKFLEVEERVTIMTRSDGGRGSGGQGMKAWLADHCPEIARSTAYKFRDIAAAVADKFKVAEPAKIFTAAPAQLTGPDAKKREKVMAFMADKSLRGLQLELGLSSASHRPASGGNLGGKRPKKHTEPVLATLAEQEASAREWYQTNALLWRTQWHERSYRYLPDEATADFQLTLETFRQLLAETLAGVDAEIKARAKGGSR
jgi:hypothetical protein